MKMKNLHQAGVVCRTHKPPCLWDNPDWIRRMRIFYFFETKKLAMTALMFTNHWQYDGANCVLLLVFLTEYKQFSTQNQYTFISVLTLRVILIPTPWFWGHRVSNVQLIPVPSWLVPLMNIQCKKKIVHNIYISLFFHCYNTYATRIHIARITVLQRVFNLDWFLTPAFICIVTGHFNVKGTILVHCWWLYM
jgi:hypothetical protein